MTARRSGWSRLREQWQANPRLRAGGVVIGLILLVWLALSLADLKAASTLAYGEDLARLRKVKSLSGQTVWLQRAEAAKALRASLAAEIPEARTAGLAQAAFQTQLGELTRRYGTGVRVQVTAAVADGRVPGVWRVPASIDAELGLTQIQQLLHDLETGPNLITLETVTVTNRDKARVSATVQAYYRLPASEVTHAP